MSDASDFVLSSSFPEIHSLSYWSLVMALYYTMSYYLQNLCVHIVDRMIMRCLMPLIFHVHDSDFLTIIVCPDMQ